MAVIEAVKAYGEGYDDVPVRLKWPNDICKSSTRSSRTACDNFNVATDVEDPATLGQSRFVKIGGILVQCSGDGKEYYLVVGESSFI
jgi:biotin--protein ligase